METKYPQIPLHLKMGFLVIQIGFWTLIRNSQCLHQEGVFDLAGANHDLWITGHSIQMLWVSNYYFLLHAKHSALSPEPRSLFIAMHIPELTNLIQCKAPHLEPHTGPGRWHPGEIEQLTSWQSRVLWSCCAGFKSEKVFGERVLGNHICLGNPFPFSSLIGWSPQLT